MSRADEDRSFAVPRYLERDEAAWVSDWTEAERSEYRAMGADARRVVLAGDGPEGAGAPLRVRETLLTLWTERPDDEEVRRELIRHAGIRR